MEINLTTILITIAIILGIIIFIRVKKYEKVTIIAALITMDALLPIHIYGKRPEMHGFFTTIESALGMKIPWIRPLEFIIAIILWVIVVRLKNKEKQNV